MSDTHRKFCSLEYTFIFMMHLVSNRLTPSKLDSDFAKEADSVKHPQKTAHDPCRRPPER